MERRDFYDDDTCSDLIGRIARLTPDAVPEWGTMDVAQMCAHCAEVAEVARGKSLEGTPWYVGLLGGFIKKMVLSERPFPKGARTHPQFEIPAGVDLEEQKARLLDVLNAIHSDGRAKAVEYRHPIFGAMTADEVGWITYKHVDHHLKQFGT